MNVGTTATRSRGRSTRPVVAAIVLAVAVAVGLIIALTGGGPRHLAPGAGNADNTFDPLAFDPNRAGELEAAAAAGYSNVLYAKSPGGIVASVRRTERYRGQIETAARNGPVDASTLEAIVLLESAGRPDVVAGTSLRDATGLTQILAETGTNLLGMHIDLAASRRLTAQIATARRTHKPQRAIAALEARRARVDQRFDPAASLAATERYMAKAQSVFGRSDLTVVSYHMGIGNLETAVRRYVGTSSSSSTPVAALVRDADVSYAKLYFDSTPLRHPTAYAWLYALGDDSESYLWRVAAARQIIALYRNDPAQLRHQAALQTAAPSAERVLRPPGTPQFTDRAAVAAARASGALLPIPSGAASGKAGLRTDGALALRPEALAALLYIGTGVRLIGRSQQPLEVTAATTDAADLVPQARADRGLADADPLHATGYAFDIARSYANHAQAQAFQFMLDRLLALNIIAWVRHTHIIHVVVGPGASALAGILRHR